MNSKKKEKKQDPEDMPSSDFFQSLQQQCVTLVEKHKKTQRAIAAFKDLPETSKASSSTMDRASDGQEDESDSAGIGETENRRRSLEKTREIVLSEASVLPLYVTAHDESGPPTLVGALGVNDAYKLTAGDYCAAHHKDIWILAEVISVVNKRYEVKDVDEEQKTKVTLARRRLIPLPKYRADPETDVHALFPTNAWVLALYPQTTCFYKGIVEVAPRSATETYRISFDDPTYLTGFSPSLEVPQRYVVAYRDIKYKPRLKPTIRKKRVKPTKDGDADDKCAEERENEVVVDQMEVDGAEEEEEDDE